MLYFIIWIVGALAVMALYSAGRANMRAEEAYQLAITLKAQLEEANVEPDFSLFEDTTYG